MCWDEVSQCRKEFDQKMKATSILISCESRIFMWTILVCKARFIKDTSNGNLLPQHQEGLFKKDPRKWWKWCLLSTVGVSKTMANDQHEGSDKAHQQTGSSNAVYLALDKTKTHPQGVTACFFFPFSQQAKYSKGKEGASVLSKVHFVHL